MPSMRVIKSKIKSVTSTQQITKAMNLVAASKLNRAKAKLNDTRPYSREMKAAIGRVFEGSGGVSHPYITPRPVKNSLIIVVSGDRGLCGGYNTNICKLVLQHIRKNPEINYTLLIVGTRGRDYFIRRGVKIRNMFSGISEKPLYSDAAEIGRIAIEVYADKEIDQVMLAFTEFKTTIAYQPKIEQLLPYDAPEIHVESRSPRAIIEYEPSPEAVLAYIIPKFINTAIFDGLIEASACELAARMTSMDSATENAEEMIQDYTSQFNRVRQGAITQELTEIVSGANALK